jgi:hypothetical protein
MSLECFKNQEPTGNDNFLLDLKFNWTLDAVFDKFGIDLGVEKVIKDRFENAEYKDLKKEVNQIYEGEIGS